MYHIMYVSLGFMVYNNHPFLSSGSTLELRWFLTINLRDVLFIT